MKGIIKTRKTDIGTQDVYELNIGISVPVIGWQLTNNTERVPKGTPGAVPVLYLNKDSDYNWQLQELIDRIENRNKYFSIGETSSAIDQRIVELCRWLKEHEASAS